VRGLGWGRSLVVGALLAVGAAPLVVAIIADPSVGTAAVSTSTRQPLPPISAGGTVDLSDALDPLPIVVDDLPDASSAAAAKALRSSSALEASDALRAFETFWKAAAGASPDPSVAALHQLLLTNNGDYDDARDDVVRPAFAVLGRDPANAGRLTDAAIALFEFGVAEQRGRSIPIDNPKFYEYFRDLDAATMLRDVVDTFGPSRAALLDWAYLEAERTRVPLPGLVDSNTIGQRRWALEWAVVFRGPYHDPPPGWEEIDLST